MILIIHTEAKSVVRIQMGESQLIGCKTTCAGVLWEMAEKFPEEIIGWCDEKFLKFLNIDKWPTVFHNDLVFASYSIENDFFPESIGYIDQMPFVNLNRQVQYPTWRMSSDIGGCKGKTLLAFKDLFYGIEDFGFLLNSIAKLGQQNSLFCYSAPGLQTKAPSVTSVFNSTASNSHLFSFVYRFYSMPWTVILFLCFIRYEKKFPLIPFFRCFSRRKYFGRTVTLPPQINNKSAEFPEPVTVDVVIPTMGRPEHLYNVLQDLSDQELKPKKVIVIEQNPDENSESELGFLTRNKWPFQISHHFIRQTGACNARNLALREVTSDWVFFADDDIRFSHELLKKAFLEIKNYGFTALNLNCKQPGEKTIFYKIKQWGAFGSGTSLVESKFAKKCTFSTLYEYGFGEDLDFGMQLRNRGCDIIYHPGIKILHLKAKTGGFRNVRKSKWDPEEVAPKPYPTMMILALRNYSKYQLKGFRVSLFLKFFLKQSIRNPLKYYKVMSKRWNKSIFLARNLMEKENLLKS